MANEVHVRLNPRHHLLNSHRYGKGDNEVITHAPKALSASAAKKVLELQYRGHPLAVEVTKTEAEATADEAGEGES